MDLLDMRNYITKIKQQMMFQAYKGNSSRTIERSVQRLIVIVPVREKGLESAWN